MPLKISVYEKHLQKLHLAVSENFACRIYKKYYILKQHESKKLVNKQSSKLKLELSVLYRQYLIKLLKLLKHYLAWIIVIGPLKKLNTAVCEIHIRQQLLSFLPGFLPLLSCLGFVPLLYPEETTEQLFGEKFKVHQLFRSFC